MVTNKIKELEAARAKLAALEEQIAGEMNKELAGLPGKYGFDSVEGFIQAVRGATGGGRRGGQPTGGGAGKKRRKRAVITEATRATVKKMVEGGKTGNEIAKALDISLPSVQNIKKALGLVRKK